MFKTMKNIYKKILNFAKLHNNPKCLQYKNTHRKNPTNRQTDGKKTFIIEWYYKHQIDK